MCTVFIAIDQHDHYPFILLANRDEFFERQATPMHWWAGREVLAGRDELAGGTWLALDRSLNYSIVTNYRDFRYQAKAERSRGELPLRALGADEERMELLYREIHLYDGFNLMSGDATGFQYITNRPRERKARFGPGLFGLSNANLDDPWPKVVKGKERITTLLKEAVLHPELLLDIMADRSIAPDEELPDTGVPLELERALSATCIDLQNYGTRVSTLVMSDPSGTTFVVELNRRTGERREFTFQTMV